MKRSRAAVSRLQVICPYCCRALVGPATGDTNWGVRDCVAAVQTGAVQCYYDLGGCGDDSALPTEVVRLAEGIR